MKISVTIKKIKGQEISEEDFKEISGTILSLGKEILIEDKDINKEISLFNKKIEKAYKIGKALAEEIQVYIKEKIILENIKKRTFSASNISDNIKLKYIILLITQYIFTLRQLMTGQELQFTVAGTTSTKILKEKTYSQDYIFGKDILSRLEVAKDGTIKLQYYLENITNLEKSKSHLSEYWPKILDWGYSNDYGRGHKDLNEKYTTSRGHEHDLYQQQKMDSLVHFYFASEEGEKKRRPQYLYKISDYIAYDRGWLYQWGKILESQDKLNQIDLYESQGYPLMPLFIKTYTGGRENLPGIRGGDLGNTQFKHESPKIISLNNILQVLKGGGKYIGILPNLESYLNASSKSINVIKESIAQDFMALNKETIESEVREESQSVIDEL